MKYLYYIDGQKFTTDNKNRIPWNHISSPDEQTPAFENLSTGEKRWCLKGQIDHRLIGPARINKYKIGGFYLNNVYYYNNVSQWLKDHPNPDLYFDAIGLSETERVLWFLQN
jgi:hypothetical protein